jgi:2-polyprenyl-3-methyl-5-hydroxy-6-metoxy-1,4-benzoquinol methylase
MKKWTDSAFFGLAVKYYAYNQNVLLSYLEKENGSMILDVGCNDGNLTVKAAEVIETKNLYGIDLNQDALEKASYNGIEAIYHDVNRRFPFEDSYFDVVISNQVLEHIVDTDNFFREIHRILKKGGYAVISTPNISSFHNLAFLNLGMQPPGLHVSEIRVGNPLYGTETHGHIKLFNVNSLKDLARYHRFLVEDIKGIGIYPLPIKLSCILSKFLGRYCVYLTIKIRKN